MRLNGDSQNGSIVSSSRLITDQPPQPESGAGPYKSDESLPSADSETLPYDWGWLNMDKLTCGLPESLVLTPLTCELPPQCAPCHAAPQYDQFATAVCTDCASTLSKRPVAVRARLWQPWDQSDSVRTIPRPGYWEKCRDESYYAELEFTDKKTKDARDNARRQHSLIQKAKRNELQMKKEAKESMQNESMQRKKERALKRDVKSKKKTDA